jgi:hypothetical protein
LRRPSVPATETCGPAPWELGAEYNR